MKPIDPTSGVTNSEYAIFIYRPRQIRYSDTQIIPDHRSSLVSECEVKHENLEKQNRIVGTRSSCTFFQHARFSLSKNKLFLCRSILQTVWARVATMVGMAPNNH
jgi:hypothetical protein